MELICTSTDKKLRYRVTTGTDVVQMKDCVGVELHIKDIIQNSTTNQDGEDAICTSIVDRDGTVYQTLSPTVADNIQSLYAIYQDEWNDCELTVAVTEKKSNKGNRFLTLSLL